MTTLPLTADSTTWRDGLRLLLRELSPFGEEGYLALLDALRHRTGEFVRSRVTELPPIGGCGESPAAACGVCLIAWVCRYRLARQRHREPTVAQVDAAFFAFIQAHRANERDSAALGYLINRWDNEVAVDDGTLFREVAAEVEREMGGKPSNRGCRGQTRNFCSRDATEGESCF